MKKFIVLVGCLFLISCAKKTDDSPQENNDIAKGKVEGKFTGTFNADKVELELNGEDFEIKINDKKTTGKVDEMGDGSILKLRPENGTLKFSEFKISDPYTLQLVTVDSDTLVSSSDYFLDKEGVE